MKHFFLIPFLCAFLGILPQIGGCNKKTTGDATSGFQNIPVEYPMAVFINEASGIADSRTNPGYLWVEEDSGNPPQLYLLGHTGKIFKKIYIKGATNRDWEDIALAEGPEKGKKYLYIAEIGDNDAVHTSSAFYRLEEPAASTDTVRVYDKIEFSYADGPRDAEAFLVDDQTKDIYIITKRDSKSRIYRIASPYSLTAINNAVFMGELPYNGAVSAAMRPDGDGIIIKTYTTLYYYPRSAGQTIAQALQQNFTLLGYQLEPQGEAVAFAQDNAGFYTISESGNSSRQSLYFYQKK